MLAAGHPSRHVPPHETRTARVLSGEQSNTSLIYRSAGMPIICKIYRQLQPGLNPDIELPTALADDGSPHVPRAIGWIEGRWPDLADRTGHGDRFAGVRTGVPARRRGCVARRIARCRPWRGLPASARVTSASPPLTCTSSLAELFPTRPALAVEREATARQLAPPTRDRHRRGARDRRAPRGDRGGLRARHRDRMAAAPADPRRLPPRTGAAGTGSRVGAARLRGRATATDGGAHPGRSRVARRRRHAAVVRLRVGFDPASTTPTARPPPSPNGRARRRRRSSRAMPQGSGADLDGARSPAGCSRSRQGRLRGDLRGAQPADLGVDPAARDRSARGVTRRLTAFREA